MNAKIALLLVAVGLGIAGLVYFFVGQEKPAAKPVQPTNAPVVVDTTPTKAALTPKEAPAPAPIAGAIAPPTTIAPGIKVYPNKHGDIVADTNTKTLTQTRKMMIRKGDGTVMEQEVLITATPAVKPLSAFPRQSKMMKEAAEAKQKQKEGSTVVTPGQTTGEGPKQDGKKAPDEEKKKKPFVK